MRTKSNKPKRSSAVYRLEIGAYSPSTMPMARIAEYIGALASILGETAAVHLEGIDLGSTVLVHEVEYEAIPKVLERADGVRRGEGPREARDAYRTMNRLLRADNASAVLRKWKKGPKIIEFPGVKETEEAFPTVRQFGSVAGELARVGGSGDTIPLLLEIEGKQLAGISTSRHLAKELAALLFEPVRLHGHGSWERTDEGEWHLKSFRVDGYERLSPTPLSSALAELRAVVGEVRSGAYDEILILRQGSEVHGSN